MGRWPPLGVSEKGTTSRRRKERVHGLEMGRSHGRDGSYGTPGQAPSKVPEPSLGTLEAERTKETTNLL